MQNVIARENSTFRKAFPLYMYLSVCVCGDITQLQEGSYHFNQAQSSKSFTQLVYSGECQKVITVLCELHYILFMMYIFVTM